MKFTVDSSAITQFLAAAGKVIAKNTTAVPILGNVLFRLEGNELALTASDLNNRLTSKVEVNNPEGAGSFTLPMDMISSVKTLPAQPITLEVNDDTFRTTIYYSNGQFDIGGESSEAYPEAAKLDGAARKTLLPASVLLKGIKNTIYAASTDDRRPTVTGVCLDFKSEHLAFVATDTKVLSFYADSRIKSEEPSKITLSPTSCHLLIDYILPKVEGDIEISYDQKNFYCQLENTTLTARLLEGEYPQYERVIPKNPPVEISINRADYLAASKRMSYFAPNASNIILNHFTHDKVVITAKNLDFSISGEEQMSCFSEDTELDINVAWIFGSLSNILDHIQSEEIKLKFSLPNNCLVVPVTEEEGVQSCMLVSLAKVVNY